MQQWQVTKRGGAIAGFWLVLLAVPVWLVLRLALPVSANYLLLAWAVAMLAMYTMRATGYTVQAVNGTLVVHRGVAFYNERRIALRLVSGVHIIRTPLQRATRTCTMVITTSGCTLLVAGLCYADACAVRTRILAAV